MEELMLKLNEFSHNHYPGRVKMLAKNIKRGISVLIAIQIHILICRKNIKEKI